MKCTLQSNSWNLLAHRQLRFGDPLYPTKMHLPREMGILEHCFNEMYLSNNGKYLLKM